VDGRGRSMVMEVLIPTPAIRNLVREDKIHQIYSRNADRHGNDGYADVQPRTGERVHEKGNYSGRGALAVFEPG